MVDFCSFNIRGLHNKIAFASDFVTNNKLSLFAILETRVKEGDAVLLSRLVNSQFRWEFNYQHHRNGRIWLGWNPRFWSIQVLTSSAQQITCVATRIADNATFILSVVYAYNEVYARRVLWHELISINNTWVDSGSGSAWCVLGDFNTFLYPYESSAPPPRNYRGISDFRDCLNHLGITDLKYVGDIFTWRDCCLTNPLMRKLDRVLVNAAWLRCFASSSARFMARGFSDHNPSAVSLGTSLEIVFKPFQVFQHLIDHPAFNDLLSNVWSTSVSGSPWFILTSKLRLVKSELKKLNVEHGDLHNSVVSSRQSLLDFQQSMSSRSSHEDRDMELQLMATYKQALHVQELFLRQKSRVKWLNCGDGNNRFFFNSCKNRWNMNKSISLEHDGVTSTSHRAIFEVAVQFYSSLMGTERCVAPIPEGLHFSTLSPTQSSMLVRPFTSDDIFSSIKHMAKNRCPGPDGFSTEFFVSSWDVIGKDVSEAVLSFFNSYDLPRIVNSAALTLIPKTANASCISQYRPISCCNVLYKTITKLLTLRMKSIMPALVSPNQTAFIQGRKLGDHVMLAQALCKDYHLRSGAPRIAFKLDISKAFDSLNWNFLFNLLEIQGFHPTFIRWLKLCIYGSMISVKINGALEGYFQCKSGLKQGDPLSPYLFVLAMEALSACISQQISSSNFKFHSRTKGADISHLIFADDVLLFCHGDNDSVTCLMKAIDLFASISGLSANASKSLVFFGNVPSVVQDYTVALSKFNRGVLPVNYLGLPLISGKLTKRDCQPLLSRICGKIEVWTSKFISQAGRAQLINSVVFGMHNNWSMYLFLPKAILKRIQSQMARFLWSGKLTGPCLYKVAWRTCCLRKNEGGLGFKELLSWNQSAILLQVCRIINSNSQNDSLWLKWVHSVFLHRKSFWTMKTPGKCSWGLRKILNYREAALQHVSYQVGRNSAFLLWHDPWTSSRPLLDMLGLRAVSSLESTLFAKVSSIIVDSSWNCGTSNDYTILRLRQICSNIHIHAHDNILWDGFPSRNARLSTIWSTIRPSGTLPPWFSFVWAKLHVPKFSFNAWLVILERLLTKDRMLRFHMHTDTRCVMCGVDDETHAHLFCHCSYVKQIYSNWDINISPSWDDIKIGRIVTDARISVPARELTYLFVMTVFYKVWRERNRRIHSPGHPKNAAVMVDDVKSSIRDKLATSVSFRRYFSDDRRLLSLIY